MNRVNWTIVINLILSYASFPPGKALYRSNVNGMGIKETLSRLFGGKDAGRLGLEVAKVIGPQSIGTRREEICIRWGG